MDGYQKKIPTDIFSDLLIGSRKSFLSLTAPDTIYKSNEDTDHLSAVIEYLSLDEPMEFLHKNNPFLQEIILISKAKNNQYSFGDDNALLSHLK